MAVDFEDGEIVAVPPAGKHRMLVDGDGNAQLLASDGSRANIGAATPVGWEAERWAVAIDRIPALNRYKGSDLVDGDFILAGTAPPVASSTKSCGVYELPSAANDSSLYLGKASGQVVIATPKAESWYVAARVLIPATFNPAGGLYQIPIGLVQAGGHATYVEGIGSVSTTVFQLGLYTASTNRVALGSVGTLGSATCPIGSFFVVAMYFDVATGTLSVEFSDEVALATTSLANMSGAAASVFAGANVDAQRMLLDAIFWAGVAPIT